MLKWLPTSTADIRERRLQPIEIEYFPGSGNGHKEVKHQLKTPNLPLLDQGLEEETPQAVSSGTGTRPCAVNNGNCEHKCSEYRGKAKCLCRPGYLLRRDRKTCKGAREPSVG